MNILARKLLRTVQATRGQFIALVVIVTLGVLIYISMNTAFFNLSNSQQSFYEKNRFADYTFQVVKAPESVITRIESLPGVIKATGRIQKDIPIITADNHRATGRLTGYPLPMEDELNQAHLLSGGWFEMESAGTVGVLTDPQYAQANGLTAGKAIDIVANGKKVRLTVLGTATSPEFIYPVKDAGSLFPEPNKFGILMIPQRQAQQILGLPGQVNQILVDLAPGVNEEQLKRQIENILEPYGNITSYPRADQLSHALLQAELDGLETNSRFLPLLFFLIAAAIQFVILSRLIRSQRLSIGVMKALGYDNRQIMLHYSGYGLFVSLVGAVLGTLAGVGLASLISDLYAQFFNLPRHIGGINGWVIVYSFLISSLIGVSSSLLAARSVVSINPAEAMRPQPPISGKRIVLERWESLWGQLDSSWRMSLRSMFRNRVRFIVTVFGMMSTVILLIFASFINDATDYLMNQNFKQTNHYDYLVRFSEPIKYTELIYWNRWDEVQKVEPLLEIPVKIHSGEKAEDELLTGLNPANGLKRIYDIEGKQIAVPGEGIIISSPSADKLGLEVGDTVIVETVLGIGPNQVTELTIVGKLKSMTGTGSYVSFSTANQLLGERGIATGAFLKLDKPVIKSIENRLQDMPQVSSVLSPAKEQENFVQLLDSMVYFIGIMVMFAGLLGLAIIYNTSVMTFQERQRELASLKVLGYSQREIASVLRKETWVQAVLGIAIGLPAGKLMGAAYMASVSTEMFSLPAVIYPQTYFFAAGGAVVFVWLGEEFAIRRVKRIDMVEALKNRD